MPFQISSAHPSFDATKLRLSNSPPDSRLASFFPPPGSLPRARFHEPLEDKTNEMRRRRRNFLSRSSFLPPRRDVNYHPAFSPPLLHSTKLCLRRLLRGYSFLSGKFNYACRPTPFIPFRLVPRGNVVAACFFSRATLPPPPPPLPRRRGSSRDIAGSRVSKRSFMMLLFLRRDAYYTLLVDR